MITSTTRALVLTLCLGVVAICVGSISWGWVGGNHAWTRGAPTFQAMVPTTAFAFLMLTVALIGAGISRGFGRTLVRLGVWATLALVGANVAARLVWHADGLDALWPFWTELGDRMSYATAFLLACAAWLVRATDRTMPEPPVILAGGALAGLTTVGAIALLHGLDVNSIYRLSVADGMSVYSLILMGAIFVALLIMHMSPRRIDEFQHTRN